MQQTISFEKGWQVAQDYFDLGERYGIYRDQYDFAVISAKEPGGCSFQMDEWRTIPTLAHLQLLLSNDPHFAPEMRLYNAAPWWYRYEFQLPGEALARRARLNFEGVDYFCKVWLNGVYLGEHEGYSTPFAFDVSGALRERNVVYVKVSSPLEFKRVGEEPDDPRFLLVERNMLKGTYEHGDSLIQRDRNPVGIWQPVHLTLYDDLLLDGAPRVDATLAGGCAQVHVSVRALSVGASARTCRLRIYDENGDVAAEALRDISLGDGANQFELSARIDHPALWSCWDRGEPHLYRARIDLGDSASAEVRFGVREVRLERSETETTYYLNGERIYVRGASYFPETYLSLMHEGRYRRDLEALKTCGCNMVRVHVHQEQQTFYDLCDKMGILVMQDTDFNWVHPCEDAWTARMLKIVEAQEQLLHNHPSIVTWVCMNEPMEAHEERMGALSKRNRYVYNQPGPQVYELLSRLNPGMPLIRGSYCENDPLSGDNHNYGGSIDGCVDYIDFDWKDEKLCTEFGFDAPPEQPGLLNERRVLERLNLTEEELRAIDYYQYRYLKFRIERFRLHKHAPTSGHLQFMLVDCSPSSFYGVYDYSGCAKPGIKAFLESNQPLGAFYRRTEAGDELWVINDTPTERKGCTLYYAVEDERGELLARGGCPVDVAPDAAVRVSSPQIALDRGQKVQIRLRLADADGHTLIRNEYDDPFHHPHHPAGHPARFSHTLGLRLYK